MTTTGPHSNDTALAPGGEVAPLNAARRVAWTCLHLVVMTVPLAMTNLSWMPGISQPLTYDQFDLVKLVLLSVLVAVALAALAVDLLVGGSPLRVGRADALVAALVVWVGLTTTTSVHVPTSLIGAYHRFEGLLAYVLYAGIYFIAVQHLDLASRVRSISRTLALTSAPVSTYGIVQFLRLDPAEWDVVGFESQRAASTFGNPEMLGGFLVFALGVALGLALSERNTRWRVAYWVAAALAAACLLVTFTRGAWAGGALAVAVLLVSAWRSGYRPTRLDSALAGLLVFAVITVGAVSLGSSDGTVNLGARFASIFDPASGSALSRFQIWDAAVRATLDRPVLGSGPGTFGLIFPAYKSPEFVQTHGYLVVTDRAHDYPLQLAATTGIPAVLLFFGLCGVIALRSRRRSRTASRDAPALEGTLVINAWRAALAGYLLHLVFGISTPGVTFLLWLALGALASPYARPVELPAGAWRVPAVGATLLAATVLVAAGVRGTIADAHFMRAQAAGLYTERAAHAERAVALNPLNEFYRQRLAALHVEAFTMLSRQAAETAAANGDPSALLAEADVAFGRAQAAIFDAIDDAPVQVENHLLLVRLYNTAGRHLGTQYYGKAISAATSAIALSPNAPEIRVQYAIALKNTGDDVEAERELLAAADLDPAYADPLVLLGELYRLNGDATTALGYYERVKALEPEYPGIDALIEQMRTGGTAPE